MDSSFHKLVLRLPLLESLISDIATDASNKELDDLCGNVLDKIVNLEDVFHVSLFNITKAVNRTNQAVAALNKYYERTTANEAEGGESRQSNETPELAAEASQEGRSGDSLEHHNICFKPEYASLVVRKSEIERILEFQSTLNSQIDQFRDLLEELSLHVNGDNTYTSIPFPASKHEQEIFPSSSQTD